MSNWLCGYFCKNNIMSDNNLIIQITHRLMNSENAKKNGLAHAVTNDALAVGEAKAVARILIEDVLGRNYAKVLAGIEKPLDDEEQARLDECVRRLQGGEPVQYVVGSTLFCGSRIKVDESVLIPRPETEELADIVINMAKEMKSPLRIMDACTGSGCLAIAIKKALPECEVCACDISEKALALARENAEENGCEIRFIQTDLRKSDFPSGNYDIIVSNPPYVMEKEKAEMEKKVLDYEPGLALFVPDEEPLIFYQALAHWSETALAQGGVLACEINAALPVETADCFLDSRFRAITLRNDFRHKPRFLICQK